VLSPAEKRAKSMATEGADKPPHSVSMTVNTISYSNCYTKPTTSTNEREEGENEQRKNPCFSPAIDNSYVRPWYSSYALDTIVQKFASIPSTYHLTTGSYSLIRNHTTTYSTATAVTITFLMGTVHSVRKIPSPTATFSTVLPTGSKAFVRVFSANNSCATLSLAIQMTVLNSTVTEFTVTPLAVIQPTVLSYTITTTTSATKPVVGGSPMTTTLMTMTLPFLTEAISYPCKLMTVTILFTHFSHPPYHD
jgi:hypothetical protein